MIEIKLINGMTAQVTQDQQYGSVNVDIIDSKGNVDYYIDIPASDFLEMLNDYQRKNNII